MSSREEILTRVRQAVAGVPDVEIPRAYRGPAPAPTDRHADELTEGLPEGPARLPEGHADGLTEGLAERVAVGLVDVFAERVHDYKAVVRILGETRTSEQIAQSLSERHARRVVVPDGFPASWLASQDVEWVTDSPRLSAADLDRVDGVLTTCAVAIAETGTIVLDAGPGQGRRALTLLPDYHLCVVRADQIVANVPDAVARLDPVRPLTWISGPSATSDIELNRVEGVHGPRTLEVLIVS